MLAAIAAVGPSGAKATAALRPAAAGFHYTVLSVTLQRPSAATAGSAIATLGLAKSARFQASSHLVSVVLTDAGTGAPVGLNYTANLKTVPDARGNIARAELTTPAGTSLPAHVRAYVVADVFPLAQRVF